MEILVGENPIEEYLKQAKEALEKGAITVKGKGRDTVKAVDVAETLKLEGVKVKNIKIDTEEADEKRTSLIIIELEK